MSTPEDLCLELRWLQFKRLKHIQCHIEFQQTSFPQAALAWSINLARISPAALSSLHTFIPRFICVVLMYISGSRNGWHFHLKESQLKGEESRGERGNKIEFTRSWGNH
jgi:hypothetical protein